MAPFIGFGWGWEDPVTLSPLEIDFLLTVSYLQLVQTLVLSPFSTEI
jgi:hypothetical protein